MLSPVPFGPRGAHKISCNGLKASIFLKNFWTLIQPKTERSLNEFSFRPGHFRRPVSRSWRRNSWLKRQVRRARRRNAWRSSRQRRCRSFSNSLRRGSQYWRSLSRSVASSSANAAWSAEKSSLKAARSNGRLAASRFADARYFFANAMSSSGVRNSASQKWICAAVGRRRLSK